MIDRKEYTFSKKYISDGIGDNYCHWEMRKKMHTSTNVFIESPTGTGKTSFFVNVLLPYAIKKNRGLIFICNREALRKQTEHALQDSPLGLTICPDEKEKISIFFKDKTPQIVVINYQSITKLGKYISALEKEEGREFEDFRFVPYYIVLDEVHFFLEDALFNVKTLQIYNYIMEKYINQVHIFMSATIKDFEKIYINTYRNFLPDHPLPQVFEELYHLHIEYYHNAYAHPVYNIVLYRNEEYLLDRIQKTEGQKWLIFVSSKDNGATLKQIISKICGRKCYFLKAQNKNNAVWNKLIDNGCYDKDVLITTKVLDNGVNIKDSNVTNVVLPFCDSTDFIQMIGRKRFQNESEKITVYVRQPKIQEITTKINSIIEKFVFCDMLQRDEYNINQKQNIVKTYWKRPEYNNLFDFKIIFQKTDIDLQTNYLAMYKLDTLLVFYSKLKQFHNNTQMHIDFLNMWLKGQIASIRHELIPPNISNLEEFLEENTNRNITDMEPFYQSFIELYNMYCYNVFITANNDEERFEKALSFRKGKTQRKATINRSLNFLGLPYKLNKKNNCWILHKLPR